MEYLCGSEDGVKPGLFPLRNGGAWLLGVTECHGWEQRLLSLMPSTRIVVGEPAPETNKASGVAIVMSPALSRARIDSGHIGSRTAWVQLQTEIDTFRYLGTVNVRILNLARYR